MKILLFVALFTLCIDLSGQNCYCNSDSTLNEINKCDTIFFENNAKILWNFNCDSSWLTFQSPQGNAINIFSLSEGLQYLKGRIGFVDFEEFSNSFLVQNNVISGCCSPPEFYLFNKETGQIIDTLDGILYISENKQLPIVVSIRSNGSIKNVSNNYNSLWIYNLNTLEKNVLLIPKNEISVALKRTKQMYPEYLFTEPILENNMLTLSYHTRKPRNNKQATLKQIKIDLKKFIK